MTPLRKHEALLAELSGLEGLLEKTPDDPLAKPLLQSRIDDLRREIKQIDESSPLVPEAELFFTGNPIIGTQGIDAKFASQVLDGFQDMVTNHFSAITHGNLRQTGKRRGETESKLFLTALPRGSFGLQLSQPISNDLFTPAKVAESMEDITGLIGAAATDDKSFVDAIANFHSRVLKPLEHFLGVLDKAQANCRIISGRKQAILKHEQVSEAYKRVSSMQVESETIFLEGVFYGALVHSGKFEFLPTGQTILSGWLSQEVPESKIIEMDKRTGQKVTAKIRSETTSTRSGCKRTRYELVDLEYKEFNRITPDV